MRGKTSRPLVSSLKGSAFRRAVCDGRLWAVRCIPTLRGLHGGSRPQLVPADIRRCLAANRP